MAEIRPLEITGLFDLTSALPIEDPGNATVRLAGALGATINCTTASSCTGLVKVQWYAGGSFDVWECWEFAPGGPTYTHRDPNTTITLSANDTLFVDAPGAYAVQFDLGGTSGTVHARTYESGSAFLLNRLIAAGISVGSNHAEDSAAASGDTGDAVLGVRNDTLASQTSTDGDYGFLSIDKRGRLMTGDAPRELFGRQFTTITSSTTETTIATAVASTFLDLYKLVIANTSATATKVSIRDATAGSVIESFYVPAGDTRGFTIPADSANKQAASNNNWTAQCGTSVASIEITACFVKNL